MTEVQIRMWREWVDDVGGYYASETFEEWQTAMRPHRWALYLAWKLGLQALLARSDNDVPPGQLHALYEQAGHLRTLDPGTPWEDPFNVMRDAVNHRDFDALRTLVARLT